MQGGCVLAHWTIPRIVPATVTAGIQEHCTKEARPPASWLPFETTKHKISTQVHSQRVPSPAKHEPLWVLPPRPVPSLSLSPSCPDEQGAECTDTEGRGISCVKCPYGWASCIMGMEAPSHPQTEKLKLARAQMKFKLLDQDFVYVQRKAEREWR